MGSDARRSGIVARISSVYAHLIDVLAGTSMAVIVVVMAVQVVARYVFNASLIWAEELCRYILVWQTFLFVGVAYQRGELIAVEVVPDLLGPRARFLLKLAASLPILVFLWLITVNGYTYATRFQHQNLPALDFIWTALTGREAGVSVFWVYVSVAIGSALLAMHLVLSLLSDIAALARGSGREDGARHGAPATP